MSEHVSVTVYDNDGMSASGHTYSQNCRHYGSICAVRRHGPFRRGDRIAITSRRGQRYTATVCDIIGSRSDIDLDTHSAREFMGPHYRVIGRVDATVELVYRPRHMPRYGHW